MEPTIEQTGRIPYYKPAAFLTPNDLSESAFCPDATTTFRSNPDGMIAFFDPTPPHIVFG